MGSPVFELFWNRHGLEWRHVSAACIAHRDPDPCKHGCPDDPGHLAGDLDQVPTSPADIQHPLVGPRMREGEHLAENMRAFQVGELCSRSWPE